jgi:hypothetical protein
MKVFVFKPTNALIGKFDIERLDTVRAGLERFSRTNPVGPYDYLESSGRTWTVVEGSSGLELQEGRIQQPQRPTTADGDNADFSGNRVAATPDHLVRRYRDSYRVGNSAIGFGKAIKVIGGILGSISLLGGFIAASQAAGDAAVLLVVYGVVAAAVQVVVFMFFGVLVSAVGHILHSTLDTAVHTSPFLDTQQKSQAIDVCHNDA